MSRFCICTAALLVAGMTVASGQQRAVQAEKLLASAQHKATIDGDLEGAIEEYRKAVDAAAGNRVLAAQALLGMAESHQKLGHAKARAIYEQLVRDYSDQKEPVVLARARLAAAAATPAPSGARLASLPDSDGLAGTVTLDGRFLSMTSWSDGEVHLRDLTTGADRAVTKRGDFTIGLSAVAKDGSSVAYQAYGGGCEAKHPGPPALCLVPLAGANAPPAKTLVQRPDVLEIAPMDWSRDGRTIAVAIRRDDRTAQVGLVNASDGSLRVLQSVDWRGPTRIVFSPDGRDVAFDIPASDANDHRHIVTVAIDGAGGSTVVEHASQNIVMGWAPDGSMLLFTSDRGGTIGLWGQPFSSRRPVAAPQLLRPGIHGSWSAGVTRQGALYFGVGKSDRDISVMPVDLESGTQRGPAVRLLQRFIGSNSLPEWTKDGRLLAHVSQRGFNLPNNVGRIIGVREMSTGDERELRPKLLYFGGISWSPSGDALVTSGTDIKGRNGIFRIDALTGEASMIVEGSRSAYPRWSPDGKAIFYRKALNGTSAEVALVERALASGAERVVSRGEIGIFTVSPDGRFIAAPIGGMSAAAARSVVEIRVDTGETRELLGAGAAERIPPHVAPRWTPDGKALLVRKRVPNEIWLVPTTGAAPRRLQLDVKDWTFGPIGQFSLHPDGERVAFLAGSISSEVMVLEHFLPAHATTVQSGKK